MRAGRLVLDVRTGGSDCCSTATGLLWFVGNFASVQVEALAWLAAHGIYLHRGPLVHVIVAYPLGVARSRLERIAVAAGYAAAMVTPAWGNERSAIVLGLALIVVAACSTPGPWHGCGGRGCWRCGWRPRSVG